MAGARGPGSCARRLQESRQHARGVEALARDLDGAPGMQRVVAIEAIEPVERLFGRGEADQAGARRQVRAPPRVLHERRTSGGQVALGPVAEPSRAPRHIRVLGDAELALEP